MHHLSHSSSFFFCQVGTELSPQSKSSPEEDFKEPHFTDEETGIQRVTVTRPRSQNRKVTGTTSGKRFGVT